MKIISVLQTVLLCVSLYVLFGQKIAFAQQTLDCLKIHSESQYCDSSWQGLHDFYQMIALSESKVLYDTQFEYKTPDENVTDRVYVWFSPSQIEADDILQAVKSGGRFLIFDETDVTRQLFEALYHVPASMEDSPDDSLLAHINGLSALPVLSKHDIELYTDSLDSPEQWFQVGLNHPSPVSYVFSDNKRYCYAFSWPNSLEHESVKGRLWVIRDESIPRNLMLKTLDNKSYLSAVLNWVCQGASDCHYEIYEPDFEYIHDRGEETVPEEANNWLSDSDEKLSQFVETSMETVKNNFNRYIGDWRHIPWRLMALSLFGLWLVILLSMVIPFKRQKGD